jgi:hypothetical protein
MKLTEEQLAGKFLIGFDTICEGHQTGNDENGNPPLYDSYDEAFKEKFIDAVCGIEGNEEHLDDEDARQVMIDEMNALIKEDDIEKMKTYMQEKPDSNYYEEFVQEADQFILGRKALWSPATGVTIVGEKLSDNE